MFRKLRELRAFRAEWRRYIRNGQYELTPAGICFPRARLLIEGVYTDFINGVKVAKRLPQQILVKRDFLHNKPDTEV